MPKWLCAVIFIGVFILSLIAECVKDEDNSKFFYTVAINLVAAAWFCSAMGV